MISTNYVRREQCKIVTRPIFEVETTSAPSTRRIDSNEHDAERFFPFIKLAERMIVMVILEWLGFGTVTI